MINVAIVGAGSMAKEHIRAFSALNGVQVTGIYSRTRAKAEALAQEHNFGNVCDNIAELKEKSAAHLVVVAVPELAANAVAKEVFVHDWAVLLEKPAGYDLSDAEDIAAAAKGRDKPVMVGFNRRFYSSLQNILLDVEQRNEHRYVHVQDQQNYEEARLHGHPEEVVQKFMYANSIHVIDMMLCLCRGKVTNVQPVMPWKGADTEVVLAHINFDSGDSALYEGIWKGPGPWACALSTPSRRWVMQPLEKAAYQNVNERVQNPVEIDPIDVEFKAGFLRQAEAVIARVRGEESHAVSLEDSLHTMRLINQIFGV
ncbi:MULTISPECIES: Gfo/Idh/MocA family protein [Thalassospira]|uniref:Dehydrogenase n=1 Tax=Thalassospira tepidiphila TaxID=393657 RepID=A0ABX0WX68_9PROT|nr:MULTISPECIES: Gfo/Idh/MocA family oxidoreductase [Thalassospira]NJB73919.1 putative dehydrogenase [Thalassospira tepidiphila]|tara:strand:- start:119 stop:1057 length:939 start_codon:yes stop_codon:yes gene_type:complete